MLKSIAYQKDTTSKPGTSSAAISTRTALITSVNRHKVKNVMGSARNSSMGFTNVFNVPKTTATIAAVRIEDTTTPGRI